MAGIVAIVAVVAMFLVAGVNGIGFPTRDSITGVRFPYPAPENVTMAIKWPDKKRDRLYPVDPDMMYPERNPHRGSIIK